MFMGSWPVETIFLTVATMFVFYNSKQLKKCLTLQSNKNSVPRRTHLYLTKTFISAWLLIIAFCSKPLLLQGWAA